MGNVLSLEGISREFNNKEVLNNVNLSIKAGEVYGLVGVNGSGKSTLMKIIMNTLKATKGNVYLFGNKVTEYDKDVYKRISAIIETPIFYEELTIEKNLEIVCRYMDLNHKERIEEVKKIVGLHGVLKKKPKELSLGMRERVAIGRGLLNRPDLVILDEPTNGLDIIKIKEIIDLITNLKRERKTSFLISTHMLDKLEVLADRVGFLYNGSIGYELGGYDLIDEKRDYVKLVCDDVSKAAFVIEGKLGIKGYKVINNNVIRLYDLKEDYNKVIQKYKTILSEEYKTETYDVSKGEYIKKKYSPEVKKYILGDWKSNEEKTISFEKLNKEETLELQHAIKDLDRLYGEKTEGDYFYKYLNEKYD